MMSINVAFSPDGKWLIVVGCSNFCRDGDVIFYDAETLQEVNRLIPHKQDVIGLAFSPDGELLATTAKDSTIKLWDMETQSEQAVLEGHEHWIWSVTFSPDGSLIASSGGADHINKESTIRLWDVETGEQLALLEGHQADITDLAFNSEGTLLASASFDHTVRLWGVPIKE